MVKQEVKIGVLEERLNEIKDNHLPHIYSKLDDLDKRFSALENKIFYTAGATTAILALLQILFRFWK